MIVYERHLGFRVLFTVLIKQHFSPAILMILSATISLLFSEFMMLLVPVCKTAVSVITYVSFKVGRI